MSASLSETGGATSAPARHVAAAPASAVPRVDDADVRRLYAHGAMTTAAGVVVAACLWLFFVRDAGNVRLVLAWAVAIHATQVAQLSLAWAYGRAADRAHARWQQRFRVTTCLAAAVWGAAAVMLLPSADVAHTAVLVLALVGMSAGGAIAAATDVRSVVLWVLSVTLPLLVVLLARGGTSDLALALLALTFALFHVRLAWAQNRLVSATRHAQTENAALVERLRRQMELTAQASREKSQFLASASHDLRQPLHALSFFGATLERRMAGSIDQPLIYNMMRSIEALDKSFGAILDISKLDAGAVEPHVQSFPVRDVFRRLQMSFAGQAEEAGLQLRFVPGGKLVTSDPQLLERILANLVQNGLRYCRPGGGVLVAARRRRGGVSLEVWDSGIGIAADELPKIFDEFYQVSNPERDRSKGLGMGLAIVKRLARLLGHEVTVRSRLGAGSVFRVWVARVVAEPIEEFTVAAETLPGALDEARTVIVLDDEETIRTSVADLLAEWGYDVVAASSTSEAVHAARARAGVVDAIVSDLRLRGGEDGLAAIEQIRAACGFDVPAVLVTGDTAPEQVLRVHESGHIVLYKPVQPKELLQVLRKLA